MKTIITILCLVFSLNSVSQIINGTVYDEKKNPLPNVHVYFDGTTIATISDANGKFSIDYDAKGNSVLVVSCLGYGTVYLSALDAQKELNIPMRLVSYLLKDVVINRKDNFTREEKLELFRKLFLGSTTNASNALIENENDIYFKYDKKNNILNAFSDKPLVIMNSSLGYKLNYELATFEVKFDRLSVKPHNAIKSFYQGVSRFEEKNNSNEILIQREKAFQGSQIHFFRGLSKNILDKENFLIYNNGLMVYQNNCFKLIKLGGGLVKVEVLSQNSRESSEKVFASFDIEYNETEQSKISFETNSFTIDKYGNNSNIENIIFHGNIAEKKVGDMLPINYVSVPEKIM